MSSNDRDRSRVATAGDGGRGRGDVTFRIWYGAAGNETDALDAITAVGADLYALGQPDVPDGQITGEPNTFIWGYASPGSISVESTTAR